MGLSIVFILAFVGTTLGFQCPEKNGYFPDVKQCDAYYACIDNVADRRLCPDGLLFDERSILSVKCDSPFNVECGDRTELQPAQSSVQCPRKNGYFSHEDPSTCDRFYSCVDGLATVIPCPSGLIYDDYRGTCTWPADAQRPGCEKENIKREKLSDGFSCPDGEVLGQNGRPLPHPTYAHPEDCQKFYICRNGVQPQLGSCPAGTVYHEQSLKCEDPENTPGCEKWFDDADA